jgi:hypothetical protein
MNGTLGRKRYVYAFGKTPDSLVPMRLIKLELSAMRRRVLFSSCCRRPVCQLGV